jgi:hypothetical protein
VVFPFEVEEVVFPFVVEDVVFPFVAEDVVFPFVVEDVVFPLVVRVVSLFVVLPPDVVVVVVNESSFAVTLSLVNASSATDTIMQAVTKSMLVFIVENNFFVRKIIAQFLCPGKPNSFLQKIRKFLTGKNIAFKICRKK